MRAAIIARHPDIGRVTFRMAAPDAAIPRLGSDAVVQRLAIGDVLAPEAAHRLAPLLMRRKR
jgi:hypothetical protein